MNQDKIWIEYIWPIWKYHFECMGYVFEEHVLDVQEIATKCAKYLLEKE